MLSRALSLCDTVSETAAKQCWVGAYVFTEGNACVVHVGKTTVYHKHQQHVNIDKYKRWSFECNFKFDEVDGQTLINIDMENREKRAQIVNQRKQLQSSENFKFCLNRNADHILWSTCLDECFQTVG